jgi:uncharacterized cupredoxin-like copper-binding protein
VGYPKRHVLSLVAGLTLAFWAARASAATVVDVDLWDKGMDTPMATGVAYGTPGLDLSKATMGMKLSRKSAPAGPVTFHVTNSSKDQIHEMIVMYLQDPTKALPYVADESRVDEDKAGDKGEVSELDPGHSGSLTVPLKPGSYLLKGLSR